MSFYFFLVIGVLAAIVLAVWLQAKKRSLRLRSRLADSPRFAGEAGARLLVAEENKPSGQGIVPPANEFAAAPMTENSAIRRVKALEKENAHLRELARIKDEFLRIVSHELRTPMDVVRGNLDMVLKGDAGKVDEQTRVYLEDSLSASDRLAKLVSDMLDTSRIETGRLKFNLQKADLADIIQHAVSELRVLAEKKRVRLAFAPPKKNIPPVMVDAERVDQVIDNLIGNAIKFAPGGTIEVGVRTEGNSAVVSVKDSGVGIKEEDLPKLFKRFPQIDNDGVGERGSGLGLYISSEILAKMGGKVWAESKGRGKGATFWFTLPLYKEPVN